MTAPSYDIVVIGAGPAGLSAASEAAKAGLKTYWPVATITGGGPWIVSTAEGEQHTARAVIVATGLNKGRLGVPNEEAYEGRGLSTCATCDGPLYAGKPVIVAGVGGWADVEARELEALAGQVTIMDPARQRIVGLEGNDGLEAVVVEADGARKSVPASAVFVYVNETPAAEFLPDLLARDATGHIVVDAEGRTSSPTVFAVGDVRGGARRKLSEAIADGRRAGKAVATALKK